MATKKKNKPKSDDFDIRAWAKQATIEEERKRSSIAQLPVVTKHIHDILVLIAAGKANISVPRMHKMLKDHFGLKQDIRTLKVYMRRYESELWEQTYGKEEKEGLEEDS